MTMTIGAIGYTSFPEGYKTQFARDVQTLQGSNLASCIILKVARLY